MTVEFDLCANVASVLGLLAWRNLHQHLGKSNYEQILDKRIYS